jgi:hypothetical protein
LRLLGDLAAGVRFSSTTRGQSRNRSLRSAAADPGSSGPAWAYPRPASCELIRAAAAEPGASTARIPQALQHLIETVVPLL